MSVPSAISPPRRPAYHASRPNDGGVQHLTLSPPDPAHSAPTINRLELLAADKGFRFRVGIKKPMSGSNPSKPATSTRVSDRARTELYRQSFKLVSSGIALASPRGSPSASLGLLDSQPVRSIQDARLQEVFRCASTHVDLLLSALDVLRSCPESRRAQLLSNVQDRPSLEELFGQDLAADMAVKVRASLGSWVGSSESREETLNDILDLSTVRVANGILRLLGIAAPDAASEVAPGKAQARQGDDQGAAELLEDACRRHHLGLFLQLATPDRPQDFTVADRKALNLAGPDWVLVSGRRGSFVVHGVVVSKPRASYQNLLYITRRREDPLAPGAVEEPTRTASASASGTAPGSRPAAPKPKPGGADGDGSPLKGRLRKRRKLNLAEKELTPERLVCERERAERGEFVDSTAEQKLLLQLSSQLFLLGVSHGLLWVNWSHVLLPFQLIAGPSTTSGPPERALAFAPSALDTTPADATGVPPAAASTSSPAEGQQMEPQPVLAFKPSPPNLILGLVQWALDVQHARSGSSARGSSSRDRGRAAEMDESDGEDGPHGGPGRSATQEPSSGKAPPHKAQGGNEEAMGDADTSGSVLASSSLDSICAEDASRATDKPAAASSPPSSPSSAPGGGSSSNKEAPAMIRSLPVARGRFADVHRGTLRRGQSLIQCVYKVNRPALLDDGEVGGTSSDDEQGGPIGRFERERDVLRLLEPLQGSVVPKLLGTARVETVFQPKRSPALVLEDAGVPIDWDLHWPSSVPLRTRRQLVEDAFDSLHSAGWLHGDVAPRNVLFSSPTDASAPGASVRVCLVDLARARRFDSEDERGLRWLATEQADVREMLDDVFPEPDRRGRR